MNYVKLGEICNIATGKYDANHGENGGDYPFYTCAIKPIKCPTYSFDGESIILPGNGANVGEVLYYNGKFEAYQRTYVLNNFQINSRFVYYQLKNKWKKYICNKQYGSATNYIRYNNLADFKIASLTEKEQQRIVNILDKADEIRTKKKLANEKLDEFLKSTFIDMFGDPVINSKQLPKVKLSDMGTLARGKSKHRPRNAPELLNGPYPLIQTGDVANSGLYLKTYNQTYSEIGLKQSKMWNAGTLCITIAANIAKTSILTFDACFPDSIVGFINNDNCNIHYIQFWLMFLQAVLEAEAPQSAQKNINLEILNSLELPYPPIEQQNQFAQIVQKVEAQKEKNQKVIEQMDNLFNSLMQQAFKEAV